MSKRMAVLIAAVVAASAGLGYALVAAFSGPHHHQDHQTMSAAVGSLADGSLYQLESRWVDDTGSLRRLRDFAGAPVVMAMIYTSCEYACPLIVADMMKIYDKLPPPARADTRFVLVSFDPARDTPDAMGTYKNKHLPADGWTLLSANDEDTLEFSIALGVRYKPIGGGDFAHSNIVIILDRDGREIFRQEGLGNAPDKALAALTRRQ